MNLLYRISIRVSIALLFLFAIWGTLFYYIIIDEINDETDDSLEDYSEYIIIRALMGDSLPEEDNGTNNSYYITEVTPEYAENTPRVQYLDEMVYIRSKKETEPARIYKTIFKDKDNRYHELTVMMPTIEKKDLKETILFWIVLLYIILLIAIIIINAFVLRRSLKPLYRILDWIDDLSLNKKAPELSIDSDISEFNKLADALERSSKRNAEMYEQQSLFIGHASHELQTPIAIAQNRLEILANDSDLTEEQLLQILKTKGTLEHISKLNKTLLLLTKIENKQFPENKVIDINQLIRSLVVDFTEAYTYLQIQCRIAEDADLKMTMNETLASVLFSNLIKNAFSHNQKGGEIDISINAKGISIANTALSGMLNPDYIFRRFYHESSKEGSIGLGLSLVESICKLYGMQVIYSFKDNRHVFDVELLNR